MKSSQTQKDHMQQILNEVAKRLTSDNPDSDMLLSMLDELHTVEMKTPREDWGQCLKNVAAAYGLQEPECVQ